MFAQLFQFLLIEIFLYLTAWELVPDFYLHIPNMALIYEREARLHNQLIRMANHDTSVQTERSLLERTLENIGFEGDPLENPLLRLFSFLDSTTDRFHRHPGLLTPRLYQTEPSWCFQDELDDGDDYILLYGQNGDSAPMDGGIYMDSYTGRVIWRVTPNKFPDPEEAIPLEIFYRILLRNWEIGKYYFDTELKKISVRRWRDEDLEEALTAWDALLSAIDRRLPVVEHRPARLPPLDSEMLNNFKLSKFARHWLTSAQRPGFRYIAPGLTTLSPDLIAETYGAESPDSYRQTVEILDEGASSLLFPSDITIPLNISTTSTTFDIAEFEKDWGYGKFTVVRRAGMYTYPLDSDDADTVLLVHPSGLSDLVGFKTACPWDFGRAPRLAEIIRKWTDLVEGGAWEIDENGVKTGIEWFRTHTSEMSLDWKDVIQDELQTRL